MKLAVVLMNLGGPDSPAAVRPFLENLFSDDAIIPLPRLLRRPLAWWIASRRAATAQAIYAELGGSSPIVPETEAQARALEAALAARGYTAKCFIAMRYWHPFSDEAAAAVKAWEPDIVVALPLYPQFSGTTTASSLGEWARAAERAKLPRAHVVCCYPYGEGFVAALTTLLREALVKVKPGIRYRVLFSAHGLPQRTVAAGDPYPWHVERTARAVMEQVTSEGVSWTLCYQSRVGRLKWIGPETDAEIRRAGADNEGVIVVPVAFVSEHSETLVELDILYARIAAANDVADYIRVPAVGTHPAFIGGLADLAVSAVSAREPVSCGRSRICPAGKLCAHDG